jgi:phage terminase large subunit GpA-like protein
LVLADRKLLIWICHFPLNRERDWFDMLTAERIKSRTVHGRAERYFYKPDGVRNEALDCRAYATAALHALYMSGFRLTEQAARMKSMAAGAAPSAPTYEVYRSRFVTGK